MVYLKLLATCRSSTALKRSVRSKQCHCLQIVQSASLPSCITLTSCFVLVFQTCINNSYVEQYCGANDCQEDFNTERLNYNTSDCVINDLQSGNTSNELIYTLMGIYAGVALFGAAVVAVLVDPIVIR